jgi:dihydroxy-acid dehydratase
VACTGGSTNAGLHLPAIAHEAGIEFDLFDVCDIFHDTPYFVDMKPGGQFVAKDLYEAGGVPVVMKELRKIGLIHEDCMTATGKTMGEELDLIEREADGRVIYPAAPRSPKTGGVVGLKGNLAPDGAIVKVAGIAPENQVFTGSRAGLRMRGGRVRGGQAPAATRKARSSSSATRGRRAARACERCWPRPRPCRVRAWARRSL